MSAPVRIQRKRTKGWKMPEGAIYVGRGTLFGNPFTIDSPARIALLRGKNLACFCPLDQACHADVLLELANR